MDIICEDCGVTRHNVSFANTKTCEKCRMLRNLLFIGDRTRSCMYCKAPFAPIARGDKYCAKHALGCNRFGFCGVCDKQDVELVRPTMTLCVACSRTPAHRVPIIQGLKKGQRARKAKT